MNADTRAAAAELARLLARALVRAADELTNATTATQSTEGEQRRPPSNAAGASPSATPAAASSPARAAGAANAPGATASATAPAGGPGDDVPCPKCGGKTWDNRISKRNPKAPDYKCRDRSCDGVIWPEKGDAKPRTTTVPMPASGNDEWAPVDDDQIPF